MRKTDAVAQGKTPEEITKSIENAKGKLRDSLAAAFGIAVEQYQELYGKQQKGELRNCYISFLRSSIIAQRALFRIDLYDENDRQDLTECAVSWDTGFLTNAIYLDIPMEVPSAPTPEDLQEWEIEALRVTEAEKYFLQLRPVMRELADELRQKMSGLQFYFGEYMDKVERI